MGLYNINRGKEDYSLLTNLLDIREGLKDA
jgi:hypothetical protein